MSLFEKNITGGNERADELAKGGAMMDGGVMVQVRAVTIQQEREEVCAALQCAASFHCLVEEPKDKWVFANKKRGAQKHRTESCVAASKIPLHEMRKKQQTDDRARKM